MENKTILSVSIISAVILIIALVALFLFKPVNFSSNTIQVQGHGQVKVIPDLVSIYFNIETKGVNASEASDKNSKIYDQIISSMIALGFSEKEITTDSFSVYEDYGTWTGDYHKLIGYRASHSIKIILNESRMNMVSKIVDDGIDAGANVNYINFELSQEKQNKYKADSIKLAAEDARIKAESLATGVGKNVGKLVSVSINEFGYFPWNVYSASEYSSDIKMVKEVASNIQPSEREIETSVTVIYKLR
jgi:uncharacterized protein YggE